MSKVNSEDVFVVEVGCFFFACFLCGSMLEGLPVESIELGHLAILVVILAVVVRFYFGDTIFRPKHIDVWDGIRGFLIPIAHTVIHNRYGVDIEDVTTAKEYVGVIEWTGNLDSVAQKMNEVRSFEVPLLAGYKTDWKGRTEVGTLVSHYGDKPYPGAPGWLRERQLHVTFFEDSEGKLVVTAHAEANSYRPDLWREHLFKERFSANEGVNLTIELFDDLKFINLK